MKNTLVTAVFAAIAIASTAAFAAAENSKNTDNQWLVDASKLEGTDIYDFHGNKLGNLQQVLVDPRSGRVRYGVVEVDKSWSWTDPMVAIPWESFAVKRGDDKKTALSVDATKEKLEKAPKFKAGDAERLFSKEASQPIYSYWSIYWVEEPVAAGTNNQDKENGKSKDTPSASTQSNKDNNGADNNNTGNNAPSKSDQTPANK